MLYNTRQIAEFRQHTFAFLEITEQEHLLTLTLNRPEKKNALNPTLLNELAYAISYARIEPKVWAVVLKARGDVWCAGMDLRALAGGETQSGVSTVPAPKEKVILGNLFASLHKPCIAQVHAPVYAGGFLIVCGCTHVVASEKAQFSLPEVKRGLFPFQVMNSLLAIMPARKVLDWCMRGKTIGAKEAHELGLITSLTNEANLESTVAELVADLVQQSPTAIRMGLEAYHYIQALPAIERYTYLSGQFAAIQQTDDAKEGIAAFNEKRKPRWTGR